MTGNKYRHRSNSKTFKAHMLLPVHRRIVLVHRALWLVINPLNSRYSKKITNAKFKRVV